MTYEGPQLDAAPPPPEQLQAEDPLADLDIASRNYWAGRTGREEPPSPTFRMVGDKKMLGRYMDPYGCQAHIRGTRLRWQQWYTGFFLTCVIAVVFGEVTFFASLIVIPLYAAWYFSHKAKEKRQYDLYYGVQQRILQSGEPEWVPYDRKRLKLIDQKPAAIWP